MAKQTVAAYLASAGAKNSVAIRRALEGKKLVVITPAPGTHQSGHNYGPAGEVFTPSKGIGSYSTTNGAGLIPGGNTIYWTELAIGSSSIEELKNELEDIKKRAKRLDEEFAETENKIAFMSANNLEEYDDNQFKVYQTLQVLKGKKTDIEKAKIIASLINS